jgi:hypothetical protein
MATYYGMQVKAGFVIIVASISTFHGWMFSNSFTRIVGSNTGKMAKYILCQNMYRVAFTIEIIL